MAIQEDKKKLKIINKEAETDTDTGQGSQGGHIEFRDFISATAGGSRRDALLSPDEIKRLLAVHMTIHEANVKKQKEKRTQYQALKEGKMTLASHRAGLGTMGMDSLYKANPILKDKAQFSGIDRPISVLPNENIADTNEVDRNKIEEEYRLEHKLSAQYRPQYANTPPKPSPFNR